ncbi:MAG: UMP kinase [Bdellovibrionaceae bacterium]|nr:UMP kinase [Pseudobdellovibrionaceae bacterium]
MKRKKTVPLKPFYKRVLIKISGELLAGSQNFGIQTKVLRQIADELKEILDLGVQVALVIGGGNIFRGKSAQEKGMDRVSSDHMGMLATCINALALQNVLEQKKIITRVLSAIDISDMAEPYIHRRAIRHLTKKRLLIFSGGTGNPYFSTDTAAALRAMEISADVLLKATKVEGVFNKDPIGNKYTKKFKRITYTEVLKKNLKIIDGSAISLCRENKMPLIIFNLKKKGNLLKAICGEQIGSLIKDK